MEGEVKLELEDHFDDTNFISPDSPDMLEPTKKEEMNPIKNEPIHPSDFVDTSHCFDDDFRNFDDTKWQPTNFCNGDGENVIKTEFISTDIVKNEHPDFAFPPEDLESKNI